VPELPLGTASICNVKHTYWYLSWSLRAELASKLANFAVLLQACRTGDMFWESDVILDRGAARILSVWYRFC